jgi:hypothetical protein
MDYDPIDRELKDGLLENEAQLNKLRSSWIAEEIPEICIKMGESVPAMLNEDLSDDALRPLVREAFDKLESEERIQYVIAIMRADELFPGPGATSDDHQRRVFSDLCRADSLGLGCEVRVTVKAKPDPQILARLSERQLRLLEFTCKGGSFLDSLAYLGVATFKEIVPDILALEDSGLIVMEVVG